MLGEFDNKQNIKIVYQMVSEKMFIFAFSVLIFAGVASIFLVPIGFSLVNRVCDC